MLPNLTRLSLASSLTSRRSHQFFVRNDIENFRKHLLKMTKESGPASVLWKRIFYLAFAPACVVVGW